jgi:hypothetical protein
MAPSFRMQALAISLDQEWNPKDEATSAVSIQRDSDVFHGIQPIGGME